MANTATFAIGDIVDVTNRQLVAFGEIVALTETGEVTGVEGTEARVHFKDPRRPKVCEACGWPFSLSQNMGTGEIECMRSGCGHGHGFEERDEVIPVYRLVNISAKKRAEKQAAFKGEVERLLANGVREKHIDSAQRDKILALL
ncbi:hypothetical protein HYT05_03860 [Candidatus Kaiserbacteria bacterium]|nr:hypothetical protein [Candidatus Kaiserbacteria bacterium]